MQIKRYFGAGLLVWLPLLATIFVIRFLIDLFDKSLSLLPTAYQPDHLLGMHIPGLGAVIAVILVLLTGIFASHFIGRKLLHFGESLLARIPLVRTIYHSAKQVLSTILSTKNDAFSKVLLVQYPREGLWSIAFQTGGGNPEVAKKSNEKMLTVFIPTTPNPTSGFLIMVPEKDAIELDMTIEQALKMVISLGVMQPEQVSA